jgi:tetratricopeptide (TPR) repeat protein
MRIRNHLLVSCLAYLLLATTTTARAQNEDAVAAQARTLYTSGTTHYNLREYPEALADFKSAYRVHPDPVFLFNIAQCYRQTGDADQAASYYRAFRRELPEAANRADVDRLINEMDKAAAARRANLPPSGPQAPATTPSAVPPAAATTQAATPATEVTAAPPPRSKPLAKKPWFWVTLGGAVIVAGGAVALGVVLGQSRAPSPSLGRLEGP